MVSSTDRLADEHLLEAALQRGVLLDVLAVFVQRGRADAVQLAARQRRLEHVAGVHRAFGLAGADHGVQLVDEQDDLAFLLGQVVEHGLEALLELAAELRAGDQRAHVQRQHAPAAQALRHFAVDDALGQALDDRGLADAGLADQHRVVLGAALQHLDRAADFLVAADHRVELAALGARGQVDACISPAPGGVPRRWRRRTFSPPRSASIAASEPRPCCAPAALSAWPASPLSSSAASTNSSLAMKASPRCCASLSVTLSRRAEVVADADVAVLAGDLGQLVERFAEALAQRGDVDAGLRQQRAACCRPAGRAGPPAGARVRSCCGRDRRPATGRRLRACWKREVSLSMRMVVSLEMGDRTMGVPRSRYLINAAATAIFKAKAVTRLDRNQFPPGRSRQIRVAMRPVRWSRRCE